MGLQGIVCRLSVEAAPEIAEIESESNTPSWSEDLFRSEFSNAHSATYGIRCQGRIAGFLVVHCLFDEAHIMNFGVRGALRRQGLGRQLIAHVLKQLFKQGIGRATLEVRRGNAAARALYDSLGFQEVGIRSRYYSDNYEDALVMSADLRQFSHGADKTT